MIIKQEEILKKNQILLFQQPLSCRKSEYLSQLSQVEELRATMAVEFRGQEYLPPG